MQKGRVSADESQGRIRVGGPNQEDVLAAQARHGLSSLLPAAGCSVSPRLQSPAAAGRDAGWFFQENSRKNSGRYLKAQHPVCTNRMNSDCPRQPEPCAGSFLLRVWQRLKEGATGHRSPSSLCFQTLSRGAGMRGGGSGATAEHGSQGEGQDRHLDVLTRSGLLG